MPPGDDDFGTIGPPEEGMLFRPIRPKSSGKSSHKHKRPPQPDGQIIDAGVGKNVPPPVKPPPPPIKAPPKAAAPPAAEAPRPVTPPPPIKSPPPPVKAPTPSAPPAVKAPTPVVPPPAKPPAPAVVSQPTPAKAPPAAPTPAAKAPAAAPPPAAKAPAASAPPKPVPPPPAKGLAPPAAGGEVFGRVPFATAEAPAWRAPLEKPALALLAEGMTPLQYHEALMADGHFGDACHFLAQAMPKTEAIIWGHTCLRQVLVEPPKPVAEAVAAVGRWLMDRTEANRRACKAAAEAEGVGYGNVAGALAMAVFWSGGSIAPPGEKEVKAKEELTGKAVGTSLLLASVQHEPHKAPDKLKTFALQGVQFASGKPDEK